MDEELPNRSPTISMIELYTRLRIQQSYIHHSSSLLRFLRTQSIINPNKTPTKLKNSYQPNPHDTPTQLGVK